MFALFPREQVLVTQAERLRADPASVLRRCELFLGLPPAPWEEYDLSPAHVRSYDEAIAVETEAMLREFYATHNSELADLLGEDYGW